VSNDQFELATVALGARSGVELTPAELCVACTALLSVDGAAITLMGTDGLTSASYASTAHYERIEASHFMLGVGPAPDAYATGAPALAHDLTEEPPAPWVGLTEVFLAAGVRAVFSVPLQVGAERIGTLTLFQDQPGALEGERYSLALVTAAVVARSLVDLQIGMPNGLLAAELRDDGAYQGEVHQAVGMVSVQLGVNVDTAMTRLRAWAFANNVSLHYAARQVARGGLHLKS
jgi:GAF domain-containing protein